MCDNHVDSENKTLNSDKANTENITENSTARYFGCIKEPVDGLAVQQEMRSEWN